MKHALKALGRLAGEARAWPHLVRFAAASAVLGPDAAFSHASERLARIPGLWGLYTRAAFYRRTLDYVGRDVHVGFMTVLSKRTARIGDRAYLGRFCTLGDVDLGPDAMLADGVQILSGAHHHAAPGSAPAPGSPFVGWVERSETHRATPSTPRTTPTPGNGDPRRAAGSVASGTDRQPPRFSHVTVGPGAWIGAAAVVMADVGPRAIVGAGAVVTRPVQAETRVAGVPARPLHPTPADRSAAASPAPVAPRLAG